MSMNFTFSRGYGEYQVVRPVGGCCYSNTSSADVLLRQQSAIVRSIGRHTCDTGGLWCFLR
jgi:hypothetical protein